MSRNKVPGEAGSMKHDEKLPGGSAPEMATEVIPATFDIGGNGKPVVWEQGENQAWYDVGGEDDPTEEEMG